MKIKEKIKEYIIERKNNVRLKYLVFCMIVSALFTLKNSFYWEMVAINTILLFVFGEIFYILIEEWGNKK